MGLGRLGLAAFAHVWLTWGAPAATPPLDAPSVAAPAAAPAAVAPPPAPPRAASPAPIAAPATTAPQVPDEERPGAGKQVRPLAVPSLPPAWGPSAQVQMGVPAPAARKPRGYLYKSWLFWTIAGGLVAGTAAITYAVTRPPPTPYYGNAGNIPFP